MFLNEDTCLDYMLEIEDIVDWSIEFIKYSDWMQ